MAVPAARRLTFLEYDALDEAAERKRELVDGWAVAMSGTTPAHAQLSAGVIAILGHQLRGGGCRVFSPDLRIRVAATGNCFYPDASVVCGPLDRDPDSRRTVRNPSVVVEVLSPSSEKTDRGRKWHEYQQIESLRHYLIVSQTVCEVQHHARTDDGWTVRVCGPGDVIVLGQPDARVDLDDLYRDVELTPPELYVREPEPGAPPPDVAAADA